ncbi:kinase-like domain-containing protein [Sphaerosporella brunnea]|uniref:Kinase-like domain-containing protein n=1 Tax=Sphaerosporella brunnea TaxID=1250544 RepID=A0A5J5EBW2_9PEZI|nr:kinase-like domain-containing protein [Sphaerosporella brunnea]
MRPLTFWNSQGTSIVGEIPSSTPSQLSEDLPNSPVRQQLVAEPTSPPSPQQDPHLKLFCLSNPSASIFSPGVKQGNPWVEYQSFMVTRLGGETTLAFKKPHGKVVAIQELDNTRGLDIAALLRALTHIDANIVRIFEGYVFKGSTFIIQECMDARLSEVIACPSKLEEHHIATVCVEILCGIQFLRSCGLFHAELTSSNILLSMEGKVKIGNLAQCSNIVRGLNDLEALGRLAIEMMEPERMAVEEKSELHQPELWSSNAINFIDATSLETPDGLAKVARTIFGAFHR